MGHFENVPLAGAQTLLENSLVGTERVLITGASGWFGRTLAAMLHKFDVPLLLMASRDQEIAGYGSTLTVQRYSPQVVKDFGPSFLVDFAFLTSDYESAMGSDKYLAINRELTRQSLEIFALPSIEKGIFASSGAANGFQTEFAADSHSSYGRVKREMEKLFKEASETQSKPVVGIKPWSVSGGIPKTAGKYAFDSIVNQAIHGDVIIHSPRRVLRRYCSLEDLLALSVSSLANPTSPYFLLESGGPLVELEQLASKVLLQLGRDGSVLSRVDRNLEPDAYFSDNVVWQEITALASYTPASLEEQIDRVAHQFL